MNRADIIAARDALDEIEQLTARVDRINADRIEHLTTQVDRVNADNQSLELQRDRLAAKLQAIRDEAERHPRPGTLGARILNILDDVTP